MVCNFLSVLENFRADKKDNLQVPEMKLNNH